MFSLLIITIWSLNKLMKLNLKKRILIGLAKFFIPFVLGFGVYTIWGLLSDELGKIWPLLVAYFFPPFGKETVIPLGIGVLNPLGISSAFAGRDGMDVRPRVASTTPASVATLVLTHIAARSCRFTAVHPSRNIYYLL